MSSGLWTGIGSMSRGLQLSSVALPCCAYVARGVAGCPCGVDVAGVGRTSGIDDGYRGLGGGLDSGADGCAFFYWALPRLL